MQEVYNTTANRQYGEATFWDPSQCTILPKSKCLRKNSRYDHEVNSGESDSGKFTEIESILKYSTLTVNPNSSIKANNIYTWKPFISIQEYHSVVGLKPFAISQRNPNSASELGLYAEIENKCCYPIPSNLIERLIRFENYNPGWNGYQSKKIEPQLIDLAMDILFYVFNKRESKNIYFQTTVFPLSSGGIQIEIEYSHRSIEIALEKNETQYLKIQETEKGEEYIEGTYQQGGIEFLLKWLFAQP
jgi:hypothetical protein